MDFIRLVVLIYCVIYLIPFIISMYYKTQQYMLDYKMYKQAITHRERLKKLSYAINIQRKRLHIHYMINRTMTQKDYEQFLFTYNKLDRDITKSIWNKEKEITEYYRKGFKYLNKLVDGF